MKKLFFYSTLPIFFFLPLSTFAASYVAVGFGDSDYNGCYTDTGNSFGGKPIYENSFANDLVPSAFDNYWRMMPLADVADPPTIAAYYFNNATDPIGNPYTTDTLGIIPGGQVYQDDSCGTPAPPTEATSTWPSIASSTVIYDPNRDYFNGLLLFMIGMTFIIWLFKGRK